MMYSISLHRPVKRLVVLMLTSAICVGLLGVIYVRFIVSFLTVTKQIPALESLIQAASLLPLSAKLEARIADAFLSGSSSEGSFLPQAEAAAIQAVHLSPYNSKYRLLLAAANSATGDLSAQELNLREALTLAPHNTQIHWRLANLLLRIGKTDEALAEFRTAATADPNLLSISLDLLTQITDGSLATLQAATGEQTRNKLFLAQFLMQKSRIEEAISIFNSIEITERLAAPETAGFINDLMKSDRNAAAYQLWRDLLATSDAKDSHIWNGSFETASPANLHQFDWQLKSSEYAKLSLDSSIAHTGTNSLRLDFFGRDTTRLSNEIKQLVVVNPAGHYRLSCFVRTARLQTSDGPVITIMEGEHPIATTTAIKGENSDWQLYSVEFMAPLKTTVLIVNIQRIPKTNFDEPTQGTIWFDDFSLTEIH